jgi:hypothetical protein
MGRTWLSVPILRTGIRIGRSIADSELRQHRLPSWRKFELCHGLIKAAEARGETLTREDADYIVDKALATGAIDADGNLNFHMRGTREEIIGAMMTIARAWGFPLSQDEAGNITDKAIRRQRWVRITAAVVSAVVIATLIYRA